MTGNRPPPPSPAPKVKLYVIDPKRFRNRMGAPAPHRQADSSPKPNVMNPPLSAKVRKKVVRNAEAFEEDLAEDQGLLNFLSRETTTRVGRVSKPFGPAAESRHIQADTSPPVAVRLKRREPPEVFRCQTCQKFYLGHTKLGMHFRKFPGHQASSQYQNPPLRRLSSTTATTLATQIEPLTPEPQAANLPITLSTQCDSPGFVNREREAEDRPSSLAYTEVPHPSYEPLIVSDLCLPTADGVEEDQVFRKREASVKLRTLPGDEFLRQNPGPSSSLPFWNVFNFSSPPSEPTPPAPVPVPSSSTSPKEKGSGQVRTVWDLVEEKLIQHGVNQMLQELSDVAEKLAKISRDKIIPIREEEEERLNSSVPIVRVENPFLSHLLDLPFGTYVFREDGGVRRPPLPPPSTELSLTSGEVDIDKFLSRDMDVSLPHLTNLDFADI